MARISCHTPRTTLPGSAILQALRPWCAVGCGAVAALLIATSNAAAQLGLPNLPTPSVPIPAENPPELPRVRPNVEGRLDTRGRLDADIGRREGRLQLESNTRIRVLKPNLDAAGGIETLGPNPLAAGRASLGVTVHRGSGPYLRIAGLYDDSLALRAGMRAGDEILAVNRTWVRTAADLRSALQAAARAEADTWVLVRREGEPYWVQLATDGEASAEAEIRAPATGRNRLGIRAESVLRVVEVAPDSLAAQAGLRAGDLLLSANDESLSAADSLEGILQRVSAAEEGSLRLRVFRDGEEQEISAELGAGARLQGEAGDDRGADVEAEAGTDLEAGGVELEAEGQGEVEVAPPAVPALPPAAPGDGS